VIRYLLVAVIAAQCAHFDVSLWPPCALSLPLCCISFFLFLSASDLRGALAYQHESLPHEFAYVEFLNALMHAFSLAHFHKVGRKSFVLGPFRSRGATYYAISSEWKHHICMSIASVEPQMNAVSVQDEVHFGSKTTSLYIR